MMGHLSDIELTNIERLELKFMQKGREEGWKKSIEEGQWIGKRAFVLHILTHCFGELPPDVISHLDAIQDHNLFDPLVDQALTAQSISDLTFPTPVIDLND